MYLDSENNFSTTAVVSHSHSHYPSQYAEHKKKVLALRLISILRHNAANIVGITRAGHR